VQSDAELIKAVVKGDKSAFAVIVSRYENAVYVVALNVLGNHQCAQDAVQETFLKVYENLGLLRRTGAFSSWILKIAERCALEMNRRRQSETDLYCVAEAIAKCSDENVTKEGPRVLAAVMRLPGKQRDVVILRYLGGYSVRDIARMKGRAIGTVTKDLSRAHRNLYKIFEKDQRGDQ